MEEQQDIVALGAGTASKKVHMDGTTSRCENVKDVDTYIDRIDEMIERKRKLFS
jgi:oxygen-independent coproporphyrinogen-3 oxidase